MPPPEWDATLRQLAELALTPMPAPAWWPAESGYDGSLETRMQRTQHVEDDPVFLGTPARPALIFQLTLAGFGHFQPPGQSPRPVGPGTGFFAMIPSQNRHCLPPDSPGWAFVRLVIRHPYLVERISKQMAATGPMIKLAPADPLAIGVARLARGAIKRDFRDRFDVELALIRFLLAYERAVQRAQERPGRGERLLDEICARVIARLPHVVDVATLATEYGLSRSHFSNVFRTHTGLTPANFATWVRVREAARLLTETRLPLKRIAERCGFANANHFGKAFRRFEHTTPGAYRRALRADPMSIPAPAGWLCLSPREGST